VRAGTCLRRSRPSDSVQVRLHRRRLRFAPTVYVVDVLAVASAVGQVASAFLAIPTAIVAYYAYRISKNAADATSALTSIERTRLHAELRPVFETRSWRPLGRSPGVTLFLAGPPALLRLDEIHIRVRRYQEFRQVDGSVEIDEQAPVAFIAHEGDSLSRWERAHFPLTVGDRRGFPLAAIESMRRYEHRRTTELRLMIECKHLDHEPWIVPLTVEAPDTGWWDPKTPSAT
jgi:hypothetical protein